MLTYRDLVHGLRQLGLNSGQPLIAHASLSAFGALRGGVETLLAAVLQHCSGLLAPAFTYRTMLVPGAGPPGNGLRYGSAAGANRMAEFFHTSLPADPLMGVLAEAVRNHPAAGRSGHPILSFAGIGVEPMLAAQTLADPLAPLRILARQGGWALLLGVDHTSNTALHLAEQMAGLPTFTRWALTPAGVQACPAFPGCSLGFEQSAALLAPFERRVAVGPALLRALPLAELLPVVTAHLLTEPTALLCPRPECELCADRRAALAAAP